MNETILINVITGFVISEALHMIAICWLVNRFTNQPLFRRNVQSFRNDAS